MLLRLIAAFILIPLIELYLLIRLSGATSPLVTIAIVVGTGILGSILARREGIVVWRRFRQALSEGRLPNREIQEGLMVVFAAALLLTPGLLTDAFGFLLLLPSGRRFARHQILPRLLPTVRFEVKSWSEESLPRRRQTARTGDTIDAEHFETRR